MGIDLLLVNAPTNDYSLVQRGDYYTLLPLGLGSIATLCAQQGFSVGLLDAERQGLSPQQIIREVADQSPVFVGLNPMPSNYQIVKQITQGVLALGATKIVFGGPYGTVRTQQILAETPSVYAIVRGEGEIPMLLLLEGLPRSSIPGIAFTDGDSVHVSSDTFHVGCLDSLPFVDRDYFIDDPHCQADGHVEAVLSTSRGCPFQCIYCGVSQITGRRIRFRSTHNVVDEIEKLVKENDVDSFYFIDDLLFSSPNRIADLATQILKRHLSIRWHGLARADLIANRFDSDTMKRAADSGCTQLAFGIESGTTRIQRLIGKRINLNLVGKSVKLCSQFGIKTKGYFMLGFPDESETEMIKTIEFASGCGVDQAFFFGVRAFPGTAMYESLLANGRTIEDLDQYQQLSGLIVDPEVRWGLLQAGIDPDSLVKYNVLNSNPISTVDNQRLIGLLRRAYKEFYVTKHSCH